MCFIVMSKKAVVPLNKNIFHMKDFFFFNTVHMVGIYCIFWFIWFIVSLN